MKIGLLIYGSLDTLSGGYLYDRKLVEYLRTQGDTVDVISLPWRNYAAHLGDNITFRLPAGLDLLIQDELSHPSLLVANRKPHPYPIVSLVHHLRASEQRPAWQNWFYAVIEKRYLQSVDGFIFNSKTTKGVVTSLASDSRPSIIAYPPTDRFGNALPEAFVAARARESTPLRIVFLGNIIERKGLHTLLEAVSLSPRTQTDTNQKPLFQIDVIGSLSINPAYAAKMQKYASRIRFSDITFHGSLDNAALGEKLKQAHLLVVPSSYEGFGIVYLEGMGFGLPAIGTSAGAASEIIEDGRTGYLITPGDAPTLAARLTELSQNRPLLENLSVNALMRYTRQPGWEKTCAKIRIFLKTMRKNYG